MERKEKAGETFELRKVLRKATQEDIDRWHNARRRRTTLLPVPGHGAGHAPGHEGERWEYQGDGTKAIFYYTAEERMDFRAPCAHLRQLPHQGGDEAIGAREAGLGGASATAAANLCCSTCSPTSAA